ncbi:RagB/SusD family nutrient uptake outer membrane protein [Mucilaginibacter sp. SJ]|uniref:RagB/SusD family nutrient uptake outer membrane protein n=1 Tax=Mucilaginibacter sp. SJ TaxID=3029053 RepID=UPI0023A965ED|nr:RagB/SusD family nutrient uptake outer membrane protein [Mucilaginibacter sp. SJ]WEA00454.1 RagB/SusD family nutrient uptake outer membrane protein [Mucilaginibacter sp. SJ]
MKNVIKFIVVLGLFATCSCKKSFLDKEPLGVLSSATFSADTTTLGLAVNRLYGSIAWREFRIGQHQYSTKEMCGDDFIVGGNADFKVFQDYSYLTDNYMIERYWGRAFENIHYCNVVIDRTSTLKAPYSAQLFEAQAKYFRAYYNFDLTNVFGDAPLRDHDPVSTAEYNIPKSSHADIIKLVISDLKYAIDHLPTRSQWGTANLGRVTKGTAQGLLSKVYLYEQDYANAKLYAEAVINGGEYSLYSNYRNLFSPDQLYSTENMMPGGFIYNTSLPAGRQYGPYLQYQGLPSLGSNGDIFPSPNLVNSYEKGDPRMSATIFTKTDIIPGFNNNQPVAFPASTNYANKKVIWPYSYWNGGNFNFQSVNPMYLRYADIILIAAEANNELGNISDALKYLEMIRFRARGNKTFAASVAAGENDGAGILPQIITTDKTALRLAIWHERRIELALEFNRWYDLVRYNKVAGPNGSSGTGYTENLLKTVYGRTNFNYAKFSHFPLPQTFVTSSNGVLKQNSAW